MVPVFGDRAIGHPDSVCLPFLDHHGDALSQKHARLELIVDRPTAGQKVPCDLIGLFGSRIAVVAKDDMRHCSKTRMKGFGPASPYETAAEAAGLALAGV